jgi:hypothetical protein
MAMVFMDGFDAYANADGTGIGTLLLRKWHQVNFSNPQPFIRPGRISGWALQTGASDVFTLPFTSQATWIIGAAFQIPAGNNYQLIPMRFYDGSSLQATLYIDAIGRFNLYNGNFGPLQATGTHNLTNGQWYFIEMMITFNNTTGAFHLKINNNDDINVTNINTVTTANNTANRFALPGQSLMWDDFRVFDTTGANNNTFIGDTKIETLFANGVGAFTQWTPTPANPNWQNVSEIAVDDDTTYNSATTVGFEDAYTFQSLVHCTSNIHVVGTNLVQRKDNPGSKTTAQLAHIGGNDFVGAAIPVLDTYYTNEGLYELNPNTTVSWTNTDVNASQFGIRILS